MVLVKIIKIHRPIKTQGLSINNYYHQNSTFEIYVIQSLTNSFFLGDTLTLLRPKPQDTIFIWVHQTREQLVLYETINLRHPFQIKILHKQNIGVLVPHRDFVKNENPGVTLTG